MAAKDVALAVAGVVLVAGCRRKQRVDPRPVTAKLTFDIRDTTGQLIPGRITLVGVGGTHEIKLSPSATGEQRGHEAPPPQRRACRATRQSASPDTGAASWGPA